MAVDRLLRPLQLGSTNLKNRVIMAPLTRNRAHPDGTPHELAIDYYRQRAGAGLIISEAAQISPIGKGYLNTPGIYDEKHVSAWKPVTDAVHHEGGAIYLQLWHVGRIGHNSLLPEGEKLIAPSAIRANAKTFTATGFADVSTPREIQLKEIPQVVEQYRIAAKNAKRAGFDGVEIHAANGYLLDQFLQSETNRRTDEYGGNPLKRFRLLKEVVEAIGKEFSYNSIGVRLSPNGYANDISDWNPRDTFMTVYHELNKYGLAYLHIVELMPGAAVTEGQKQIIRDLRPMWTGTYIANGEFDADKAETWIKEGRADAIAFGRPFISNPDLPERFRQGAPLNPADPSTFYGGDYRGYTDYPFLNQG